MATDDKITDEKLQYDINWEAANMSPLSSGEIHENEYLIGEEILPPDQSIITEPAARFTYSPLGKSLEEQTKTMEDQVKNKQKHLKNIKRAAWI